MSERVPRISKNFYQDDTINVVIDIHFPISWLQFEMTEIFHVHRTENSACNDYVR